MRITNNMMTNQLMMNLERNLNRMSRQQDQLATGKQILAASDDPIAASKILKYKTDLSELNQFGRNADDALSWLDVTESAIGDTGNVLQRIRELTVQGANGALSALETQQIAKEVTQLKEHIINNGNFSFAGRYVFSGTQTDKKLFNADGTYNIDLTNLDLADPQKTRYQIGVGEDINVSTNGIEVFGYISATYAPEQSLALGSTAGSPPPTGSVPGVASTKAVLKGAFPLNADYTVAANSLDITYDGLPFTVNTAGLDGTGLNLADEKAVSAFKGKVLDALNNGVNGGVPLSDVADVFFDQDNQLVIQAKSFGVHTLSEGSGAWTAAATAGTATVNPVLTDTTKIMPGAIPAATQTELKNTPFYLTVNGESKRIQIDSAAPLATPADYQTALQSAIDTAFGAGVVTVGEAGGVISFSGLTATGGNAPSLQIDHIQAKQSSLIADLDTLIADLNAGNTGAIGASLTAIDTHMNRVLSIRADIGARSNRMDLVQIRISENSTTFSKMLSDVEDADMGGVIMQLKNAENVYRASLSVGAKVIQPSLIDFIR